MEIRMPLLADGLKRIKLSATIAISDKAFGAGVPCKS
jgi:hypothetical protein